jgi:hypothetical protein
MIDTEESGVRVLPLPKQSPPAKKDVNVALPCVHIEVIAK